jgi:hypothetical protein
MTQALHVRPDRLRTVASRVSELTERLSRDLDRWLRHPATPPAGAAPGGAAEQAARVLVATVERYLMRAVAGLADAAGALVAAADAYETSDGRASSRHGAAGGIT